MTEKTDVARLDYSKPPPGYEVDQDLSNLKPKAPLGKWAWLTGLGVEQGRESAWFYEDRGMAIDASWVDYKAHNDPPGMWVKYPDERGPLSSWGVEGTEWPLGVGKARAAAWAWHDRRHALAAKMEIRADVAIAMARADGISWGDFWPHCLTWTNDQVAEVERWLLDSTAEMPEVLRG